MQTNKCYVISGKETTVALNISQMIGLCFNLQGEWPDKAIAKRLATGELSCLRARTSKEKALYHNSVCLPLESMLFQNKTSMRRSFQSKVQDTSEMLF